MLAMLVGVSAFRLAAEHRAGLSVALVPRFAPTLSFIFNTLRFSSFKCTLNRRRHARVARAASSQKGII